ncbi:phosphonate C-P lyase system protein PhnH [Pseudotabrizicola sp. L79]|uniref:phosphonate C-P lyase system protein PhnH n=1 Tax=Pseudotabrizicola sp. L79 TaxID=3118402 RepID=UPI002F9539F2
MTSQAQDLLSAGFADFPVQSARAFRILLEAMARPGSLHWLADARPPAPMSAAAGTTLLTLADDTTPVFLCASVDSPALRGWIAFHIGAPVLAADAPDLSSARFAYGPLAEIATYLSRLHPGEPDYPDRSATVLIEMPALRAEGVRLTGPGIQAEAYLNLSDPALFQANHARFPLGFDFYLTCRSQIAGVPRSTNVGER